MTEKRIVQYAELIARAILDSRSATQIAYIPKENFCSTEDFEYVGDSKILHDKIVNNVTKLILNHLDE